MWGMLHDAVRLLKDLKTAACRRPARAVLKLYG